MFSSFVQFFWPQKKPTSPGARDSARGVVAVAPATPSARDSARGVVAAVAPAPPPAAPSALTPVTFARISASRGEHPICAFAGGALPTTLLSCCSTALLRMLSTAAMLPLRAACKEAAAAIAAHPWEDSATAIRGRVRDWRACFPRARAANLDSGHHFRREPLQDADFMHLAGLRTLSLYGQNELTDAAFAHLRGIHTLDMSGCWQITDAAFAHLAGIQVLDTLVPGGRSVPSQAVADSLGLTFWSGRWRRR